MVLIARPYMGHGTVELADIVNASPDLDTLRAVAAELQHRHRPKAKALAERVAIMLGTAKAPPPRPVPPVRITLPAPAVRAPAAVPIPYHAASPNSPKPAGWDRIEAGNPDPTPAALSLDDVLAATMAAPPAPAPTPQVMKPAPATPARTPRTTVPNAGRSPVTRAIVRAVKQRAGVY